MQSWVRLLEVPAVMGLCGGFAWWVSNRGRWAWAIVYLVGLALVAACAVAARFPGEALRVFPSWILAGPHRFPLVAAAVVLVLVPPCARLPDPRQRRRMFAAAFALCVLLGAVPAVSAFRARMELASLGEDRSTDGVCRQQTDYTCGPAAAVTALRLLGLHATESELALLAGTSPHVGTPAVALSIALSRRFAADGLQAEMREFKDLEALRGVGIVLVEVKFGFLVDHWICVREVTDRHVVVGDPLVGWESLTHAEFLGKWRRTGIVLRR